MTISVPRIVATPPPGSRGTLLLAEDDPLVAQVLASVLEREGFRVIIESELERVMSRLDETEVDVVVSDMFIVGGTGLDVLRHLDALDTYIPAIIITADQSLETAAGAVREQAFDYLCKPVSRQDLVASVLRAIKKRRQAQSRLDEEARIQAEHRRLTIRHQRTAMLLQVLYNRAVEGILVVDASGRIVDASESFVALAGVPLHEMVDQEVGPLFVPHPSEGDIEARILAMAAGPLSKGTWRGDITVRGARDRQIPAKMSLSVCESPAGDDPEERTRYVIALIYYDRAYDELQRQLQQADRLANIGLLAGSAAHEIKNELGPLVGYLTMIERGGSDPVETGMIKIMRESVRRVHEHVEQILTPLRPRLRTRGAVVLREQVDDILVLLKRAGRLRRINIELVTSEDDPVIVHADKDEIHQIALNLITNAVDALGDGDGAGRGSVSIRIAHDGEFGLLEVRDSGAGVPEELRGRVFEPFFTTKGAGGTGLGLPVVHNLVRSLRGSVSLDAADDRGTVVEVRVPRFRPA